MQDKFRLYRRPNGMLYAEECGTRHRESLQTKNEAEARCLIATRNQAASQPVFMEMAKVYLRALPWTSTPWLALLVYDEDDLQQGKIRLATPAPGKEGADGGRARCAGCRIPSSS